MHRTWRGFRAPGRVLLAILLLAAAAGTALSQEQPPPSGPEQAPPDSQAAAVQPPIPIPEGQRTFKQFATIRVDDVVFAAGWQLARPAGSENADYLPLVVGLQSFKHKMWGIKQKDLQLFDEAGAQIQPVPLKDVRKNHSLYVQDYQNLARTTILNQLLADAVSGAPGRKIAPGMEAESGVRGIGESPIDGVSSVGSIEQVSTGQSFYGHTLFYPSPGETAVYAATLDYKYYAYDILYYADVLGKWLRLHIPEAKNRPAIDLVFKPEVVGK